MDAAGDPAAGGGNGAGAGAGQPGAFDATAFRTELRTELLTEIRKDLNGIAKSLKTDISKLLEKKAEPPAGEPPAGEPPVDPTDPKIDPVLNAKFQKHEREMAELKKKYEAAEAKSEAAERARLETERVTFVRNTLNELSFGDQSKRELFFKATQGDVKYDDEGRLVVETDSGVLPAADWLKTQAETTYSFMLASKGGGGAGAGPGNKRDSGVRGGPVKMSDLTPEKINAMKPEERAEQMQQILAGNIV
jgi:hypothetical protein